MKAKYVLVVVCWLCVGCPPQMEFVVDRVDRQTIGYGRCGCATFWLSVTRQTGASEKRSWSTRSQSRRGPNTADSFCRRIHGFPTRDASAKNPSCCPSSLVLFENFTVVVCVAWRCLEVLAVVVVLGVVGLSDPTHTAAHHTNWRKKKTNLGKYTCKRANERTHTRRDTREKGNETKITHHCPENESRPGTNSSDGALHFHQEQRPQQQQQQQRRRQKLQHSAPSFFPSLNTNRSTSLHRFKSISNNNTKQRTERGGFHAINQSISQSVSH